MSNLLMCIENMQRGGGIDMRFEHCFLNAIWWYVWIVLDFFLYERNKTTWTFLCESFDSRVIICVYIKLCGHALLSISSS